MLNGSSGLAPRQVVRKATSVTSVLNAVADGALDTAAEQSEGPYLPVATTEEAKTAVAAAALGVVPTAGHKLPVKARALGLSGKQLRKLMRRTKAVCAPGP